MLSTEDSCDADAIQTASLNASSLESNERIHKYGGCDTLLSTNKCELACQWRVADVGRAVHSISKTTGPANGPGLHDVLFSNRVGVDMPAGIVKRLLKQVKQILTYERREGYIVLMSRCRVLPGRVSSDTLGAHRLLH